MRQSSKQTIAGVVLCLNEAKNLPRALASLTWCDEVLVVDSGSTDGSQEIAIRYGARVLEHRQVGQFLITEQRNWALNQGGLQSDWVLFLDADEEIGGRCKQAIQKAIQHPAAADGYELTPRYWFLGRWLKYTQGYPNWHPRLLKRGILHFEGGVWESFLLLEASAASINLMSITPSARALMIGSNATGATPIGKPSGSKLSSQGRRSSLRDPTLETVAPRDGQSLAFKANVSLYSEICLARRVSRRLAGAAIRIVNGRI